MDSFPKFRRIDSGDPFGHRVNWGRLAIAGSAAGVIINAFEFVGHRVLFGDAWTAAFHALGKTPTGWLIFVPANFAVGILTISLYARLRLRYGGGPISALRSGLATWAVFWLIPLMSIMPMDLFPNSLLAIAIALGLVDVNLAALIGAWLYKET